jgi:hypothetical protein
MGVAYIVAQLEYHRKAILRQSNSIQAAIVRSNLPSAYKSTLTEMIGSLVPNGSRDIGKLKFLYPERRFFETRRVRFGDAEVTFSFPDEQRKHYSLDVYFPKNGRNEEAILDLIFEDSKHDEHSKKSYHWTYFVGTDQWLMCHRLGELMSLEAQTGLQVNKNMQLKSAAVFKDFGVKLAPFSIE